VNLESILPWRIEQRAGAPAGVSRETLRASLLASGLFHGLLMLLLATSSMQVAAEGETPAVAAPAGVNDREPGTAEQKLGDATKGKTGTKERAGSGEEQQRETLEERQLKRWVHIGVIAAAMLILAVVAVALYFYISALRDKVAEFAATDEQSRKLFLQMGLGVPDGTIRSALAVMIVLGALLALIAAIGKELLGFAVPEALTGVFGTILGFYFGRSGSVEASQATSAMANAAQMASAANDKVAEAKEESAAAKASAQTVARAASEARLKAVGARIGPLAQAVDEIVAFAPLSLLGDSVTRWRQLRETLTSAASSNSLEQLEPALEQLGKQGPVATLLAQVTPALAPLVQPGQSAADALRMMMELNLALAPEVAQRWALRVLGLPFQPQLIDAVIDDEHAAALIKDSVVASRILAAFQGRDDRVPMSATHLVKAVLSDDAVATLTEELVGIVPASDVAALVEQLQKAAVEQQLQHDLPPERVVPFGGLNKLLAAIDQVRTTEEGQQALDIVLGIVRRARSAGVPLSDLFSPQH
jgi:hypothetical protein